MICTLPNLQEMMKRSRIETCERVCPEHRIHIVRDGKLRDELRIDPATLSPPSEEQLSATDTPPL